MAADGIALIDLYSSRVWVFQYFPAEMSAEDRANWEPQNVSIGKKPLLYGNREPRSINISDVLLDSETDESLTKEIEEPAASALHLWGLAGARCTGRATS